MSPDHHYCSVCGYNHEGTGCLGPKDMKIYYPPVVINGRADLTSRLIMAQLAHKHRLIPMQFFNEIMEKQNDCQI
jgi:C4-type Zn-finger protein